MHRYKIRLDTVTDIGQFVLAVSDIKADVYVTSGRVCVNGKSFLGLAHAKEFAEIFCECDEDIYTKIPKFIMGIMDGKTVFITGGTRGVGFALATRALEEGAKAIAICGSKEETVAPALAKLKEAFPAKAEEIFGYWPSLRVEAEIARDMNDFVAKVGRLDVCCSNAGITHNTTIKRIPEGDFQNQVDINLTATYYVDRQAGLIMSKQRGGSIVNTASMTGLYGSGMGCGYGASKAGVIGLTRSLGRELAFFNVRVNCVAPGVIDTDMVAGLSPEAVKAVSAGIALRRMARPEEVANAILFLGSDLASYCTATCLSVDGWTT